MFFSAPFISAALMALSAVEAVPPVPANGLTERATCSAGYYPNNRGRCTLCPAGNYCPDGQSLSQCGTGQYQPKNGTTTVCPNCPAGTYQPNLGQASCIPAPKGGYVLNSGASSYNEASGGAFTSFRGQNRTCLTCCGYAAVGNGNTNATRCPTGTFAYPGSGSGCFSGQNPGCTVPANCTQLADGTCPAGTSDH
ncbi:hypothetical protein DFH07DRAFT_1029610 [Mycena maculata]|uniref:Tyrosine-protein kinase ephrin type A/B receptor-like domain-containing protein n=1 Tax=Mycena maculata TaxID=230809 RepID=A0AAD7J0C6_9AGAR|nr:hypothetical protein DFH07DRAFT_1029610 [Mycena maculata]